MVPSLLIVASCGDGTILVGYSGPLQGRFSDLGVQGRNGAQLAVEEINANGGVAGHRLRLLVEDDSGKDQGPVAADQKLMDAGVVAIIGHMTSAQTLEALPHALADGALLISPTTTTPELSGKADNFFRLISSNTKGAKALARFATKELGVETLAILWDDANKDYATSYIQGFTKAFKKSGGEIVTSASFSSHQPDASRSKAAQLFSSEIDAGLLVMSAFDAVQCIQEIRSRAVQTNILIAPWAYTEELVDLGGAAVNHVYTAMDFAADNKDPAFKEFKKRFKARFGQEPNFAAAFAYESVLVLATALETTRGRREGLEQALTEIRGLQGVVGTITLDANGDVDRPYFILTVKDETLVSIPGTW